MAMILSNEILFMVRESIAIVGVIVICVGTIYSVYHLIMIPFGCQCDSNYIRLQFGNSIILGLEFMVGADIIGSLVAPDYYNLGLLAIIVMIRTALCYFLTFELQSLKSKERRAIK